ncbi:precorrin-6y C5,15-methyltransferase (decarboxylating) CbiE subunit [Bradyrhizobium sp. i1.3.6]
MADPWLTIIGIGEDGLAGLSEASRKALAKAETVFGGERHLALADVEGRGRPWPVPFDADIVVSCRGRPTVVLASGDPFWHGAGASLAEKLDANEWIAHSAPSTFSLAAARLGWRLEAIACLGLHAAPFERLVPYLAPGARIICLMRDGKAAGDLAKWLSERGWGASAFWTLAALGGARESIAEHRADGFAGDLAENLVAVAVEARGGQGIPRSSGLSDDLFAHDGQITKRPVRALALSALAPRPGERLWDIGARVLARSRSNGRCAAGRRAPSRRARIVPRISAAMQQRSDWRIGSPSSRGARPKLLPDWKRRTRSSSVAVSISRCSMPSGHGLCRVLGSSRMR